MSYEVKQQQVKELGEKLIAIAEPKQAGNVNLVRLICLVQSNMNMAAKGELTELQLDGVISEFSHNIGALQDAVEAENVVANPAAGELIVEERVEMTPDEVGARLTELKEKVDALYTNYMGDDGVPRDELEEIIEAARAVPIIVFNV